MRELDTYDDSATSGHHTSAATHARPLKTDINLLIYDSVISAASVTAGCDRRRVVTGTIKLKYDVSTAISDSCVS